MTWIDNLKNTSNFELNDTIINDTDNLMVSMIDNANDLTNGTWFITVIIALFVILVILFMKKDIEEFRYDAPRAFLISSFICLTISIIAVITPYVTTFMPVIWFGVIFLLSFFAAWMRKENNK